MSVSASWGEVPFTPLCDDELPDNWSWVENEEGEND